MPKTAEKIFIKYFDNAKRIEKMEIGDWIDLRARTTVSLSEGQTALIPLGVAMKLPKGYEAHVAPRSGTYRRWGVIQTNSVGVIDESYCGDDDEWMLPVKAERDTTIYAGDRICQFRIVEKQPEIEFVEVSHLNDENRGGFGSTGVN